jgi:hypothetical protein
MGWAYRMKEGHTKCTRNLFERKMERGNLKDIGVDGRLILKWNLEISLEIVD